MLPKKKIHPKEKTALHARNKHRERYDFKQLIDSCPELSQYVKLNAFKDESIDFFDPKAVMMLNKALLKHYYNIEKWDIPQSYLCPPIPGRADYIHHIADLLCSCNSGKVPIGSKIKCLDIGVGANCVYPIIGNQEYAWSFVGSDIDKLSIASATKIITQNSILQGKVELRIQTNPSDIFYGIVQKDERFDVTICNPPFHASFAEAQASTMRKLTNLHAKRIINPVLNFGGQQGELWCNGGEGRFVRDMILQSKRFSDSCFWFSSIISKSSNLKTVYETLKRVGAVDVRTIPMSQGNKIGRIVSWTFLNQEQQKEWVNERWK